MINYDSLKVASYAEKLRIYNSEIFLQNSYSNYFGILPFLKELESFINVVRKERLFKINESDENYPLLQLNLTSSFTATSPPNLVLHEFYTPYLPNFQKAKISFLGSEIIKQKKRETNSLDRLVQALSHYEQKVIQLSTQEELNKDPENIEWFIGGEPLTSYNEIFYYDVFRVRNILENFQAHLNVFPLTDLSLFKWKLSTRSVLQEVVANLIKSIRDCLISQKDKAGSKFKGWEDYVNRQDDVFATLENYLNTSVLRKLINMIIRAFIIDLPYITRTLSGFYFVFEKTASPKKVLDQEDYKHFHVFDRIIGFSHVNFQVVNKLVLVKINYFVEAPSLADLENYAKVESKTKDVVVNSKPVTKYLFGLFNKYDIYHQLMPVKAFVDNFLDKKLVDDTLASLSSSISSKSKKHLNFTINYHKIYRLYEPLIEKAVSSTTSRAESDTIFAMIEAKLLHTKSFLVSELPNKIENMFFSEEVMTHLAVKIQLQNYLYRTKKTLVEHLQEETFAFNTYPVQQDDQVIVQDLSLIKGFSTLKTFKFVFLIQIPKETALRAALVNQEYLILGPSKIEFVKVTEGSGLPLEKKAHYLLISPTWPNLDFCSNNFERVLILDGRNKIIDVTESCLKELIHDLQTEDPSKFNNIYPYLVNQNLRVEEDIAVTNLFPLYPALISFQLKDLEPRNRTEEELETQMPKLKSFQSGMGSQMFDDQKVLDIFFTTEKKLDVAPFIPEELKFSQRLRVDADFHRLMSEMQAQFAKLLKSSRVKEFVDEEGVKLPDIVMETDYELEWTLKTPLKKFNEKLKGLFDDVTSVMEDLFWIITSDSEEMKIQDIATKLLDDIFLENQILTLRSILSVCRAVNSIQIFVTTNENEKPLIFDSFKKSLRIAVLPVEDGFEFSLTYPHKEEMKKLLAKAILEEDFKGSQQLVAFKASPSFKHEKFTTNLIEKMSQAIAREIKILLDFDPSQVQNVWQVRMTLLVFDLLVWSLAEGVQLAKTTEPALFSNPIQRFELHFTNDKSVSGSDFLKAKIVNNEAGRFPILSITYNISTNNPFCVPDPTQSYLALRNQLHLGRAADAIITLEIKALDDLIFKLEERKAHFEARFEVNKEALDYYMKVQGERSESTPLVKAFFLGLKDLKVYPCEPVEIFDYQDNVEKKDKKWLKISLCDCRSEQNYLIWFMFEDNLVEKAHLANIYCPKNKEFKALSEIMEYQEKIKGKKKIFSLMNEPVYIVTKLDEKIVESSARNKSLIPHLRFYTETRDSVKKITDLEKRYDKGRPLPPPACYKVYSKNLDETKVVYKIISLSACTTRIKTHEQFSKLWPCEKEPQIDLKCVGNLSFDLPTTAVIAPNNVQYKTIEEKDRAKPKPNRLIPVAYLRIYKNLGTFAISKKAQGLEEKKNEDIFTEKDLKRPEIQTFMENNFIQNLIVEEYRSISGEERTEMLVFRNEEEDETDIAENMALGFTAIFQHNKLPSIKFAGEISKQEGKYYIKWRPFIKGSYTLFLDDVKIKCATNLVVLADQMFLEKSTFIWPEVTTLPFYESFSFELQLRDKFGNRFNNVDIKKHYVSIQKLLTIELSVQDAEANTNYALNDHTGTVHGRVCLVPKPERDASLEDDITLNFFLNKQPIKTLTIKPKGIAFSKRLELFSANLDLGARFKRIENVNFTGEPGIDAGGLRREFWEIVGKQFKNSKYKVFDQLHNKYFLSYDYTLNAVTKKSLNLYGALLAGSLSNRQILGVNFVTGFAKILFGNPIRFEDLKEVVGDQVFNNYQSLKEMSPDDLDILEQYFVVNINNKQYELVKDGDKIKVDTTTVDQFLEKLAQFYLETYHQEAFDLIKEGFSEVFALETLKKWFAYTDLPYLTFGTLNVTGENILPYITFYNENEGTLNQFFAQFIRQAEPELLQDFLKFTTGSSALPYGDASYRLNVSFHNRGDNALPISHTCSKHIEVPKYKSYEQLKKLLTAAFMYGSEGFAFG